MLTLTNRIDMRPGAVPLVIHLGQYDSDFSLVFELYSSAGNFTVESGTTAMIRGTKTDGNAYDADATIDISAKTVTVAGSEQMTAAKGRNVYELVLTKSGKVLSTANFILDVERAAMDADTIASESVLKELNAIIAGAETATDAAADAASAADRAEDAAESVSSASTQIATNTADIADLKADLKQKTGLSEEAKVALLNCFEHVAWIDEHGQTYYDNLYDALYPDSGLDHITAVFAQGSLVVYPSTPLNDLKPYLTVTGYYKDGTSGRITDYALSGTLSVGTSTVTVMKDGKTTTFNVTVSQPYWDYEWYAGSKSLPDKMTGSYYDFTTEDGALYIENPSLDFGDEYTGDMRILIECKLYSYNKELEQESYRNLPQIVIANGNAKGCKLIGSYGTASNNPNFYVAFGINNVNSLVDGIKGMDSHVYDIKSENGVHTLSVDGSAIPVTQNTGSSQWITKSCITSGTPESPLVYIMCIKHLAYKAL